MDPKTEHEPESKRLKITPSITVPTQQLPLNMQPSKGGKKKEGATKSTLRVNPPTWSQIQNLASKAQGVIEKQGVPETPATMFMAMLAVLSCQSNAVSSNPSSNTSK
ncbi:endogenous retrovirus group K member 21 Rec protein [Marmota monax]|uniref:endogenous retrovirus group K member 21 Rec protein-like n=1 Tax=Marmota marmota marmota TaxID=9994 RepID=UPI00076258D7|nr:endogenous retrovirus group K member 21 Rec protein-like [Marmota marmota marmota]XP_027782584.1 endogenous retrovirus group K member 21 Rec protein-like [Marmota flaviventris]XP_027782585.1 endogenous retrovirus group K member 21 Rec protein-like [Marmota flaviventris]XP_027782586.1 endogenous retrovirus group K member 21 Rec protein-like [Marmota flaviventris]XP_046315567.1 endogenous retrovirus group K member 21 Rec protein [Marmota monax]